MLTVFLQLGERYKKCYDVSVDQTANVITITKGESAIYVQSQHQEVSTYTVEGAEPVTLETNSESKNRYYYPYNLSQAPAWAQQIFQGQQIVP